MHLPYRDLIKTRCRRPGEPFLRRVARMVRTADDRPEDKDEYDKDTGISRTRDRHGAHVYPTTSHLSRFGVRVCLGFVCRFVVKIRAHAIG